MPAVRVFWYDCCSNSGDQKCRTRLLLRWIADDDLRGIAKYSILLRGMQLLILIPTFVVLVMTYINTKHLFSTMPSSSTTILPSVPCSIRKLSIIVWFFWSLSFLTVICSIVLDIFM